MKKLLVFLVLLTGCSAQSAQSFKQEIQIESTVIDLIETDQDYFYIMIEPVDTDHNSTLILKSLPGQTMEQFQLNSRYTFTIYTIAVSNSNRLELSMKSYK